MAPQIYYTVVCDQRKRDRVSVVVVVPDNFTSRRQVDRYLSNILRRMFLHFQINVRLVTVVVKKKRKICRFF
jgi:hypothetical protein